MEVRVMAQALMLFRWIPVSGLAFLAGWLTVRFLVVHPLSMSLYLALACAVGFATMLAIGLLFRGWMIPLAVVVALGLFVAGYWAETLRVLATPDPREIPELTRAEDDPGLGHTAVVYFTHGEPSQYNPIGWINQFNEFDEQGIAFVPTLVRPIFLYQLRNAYLKVGRSSHRENHIRMLAALEQEYRDAGDTDTRFYLSFLDDEPRPDAAAIQALNDGARRIILSEVFLTVSNHTVEGEELVEALQIEERFGVEVLRTGPLWDSDLLRSMFVARANDHLGGVQKNEVAILLVGHGQPDEWDAEWGTETEHENAFRYGVLDLLTADGFNRDLLALAWMEFKEPKPAAKIEEFIELGAKRLLFFSAAISAESIHSQYDIPELVHEATFPEGFEVVNLGAWDNDPLVIAAIKERIDAQGVHQE
jgi:sirohydrochlorin ferrochelatase